MARPTILSCLKKTGRPTSVQFVATERNRFFMPTFRSLNFSEYQSLAKVEEVSFKCIDLIAQYYFSEEREAHKCCK